MIWNEELARSATSSLLCTLSHCFSQCPLWFVCFRYRSSVWLSGSEPGIPFQGVSGLSAIMMKNDEKAQQSRVQPEKQTQTRSLSPATSPPDPSPPSPSITTRALLPSTPCQTPIPHAPSTVRPSTPVPTHPGDKSPRVHPPKHRHRAFGANPFVVLVVGPQYSLSAHHYRMPEREVRKSYPRSDRYQSARSRAYTIAQAWK